MKEKTDIFPVKLVLGMISQSRDFFLKAEKILEKKYGKIDFQSMVLAFKYTDYYQKEMGVDLLRKFISFKKLINPENLAEIKIFTNRLEDKFSVSSKRKINLDPGYITLGKLVLATTKNQQHRIYLKGGIFAEVTLRYKDKTYQSWEWTYFDYKSSEYIDIFDNIRKIYKAQL